MWWKMYLAGWRHGCRPSENPWVVFSRPQGFNPAGRRMIQAMTDSSDPGAITPVVLDVQVVPDAAAWSDIQSALSGVEAATAEMAGIAHQKFLPRAMQVGRLLFEQRQRYASPAEFHAACLSATGLSRSQVENYLQIHRHRVAVQQAIDNGAQIHSLRAALSVVRTPRPERSLQAEAAAPDSQEVAPGDGMLPVVVTVDQESNALDLLSPLVAAEQALPPLIQHPRLQGRGDLIQRLGQVAEVLAATRRSLAAALRPTATADQTVQPSLLAEAEQEEASDPDPEPAIAEPLQVDSLLADGLGVEPALTAMAWTSSTPPDGPVPPLPRGNAARNPKRTTGSVPARGRQPATKDPLKSRYPSEQATQSLRRLAWDIDQAGSAAALGRALGCSRQAVSLRVKTLETAIAAQGQTPDQQDQAA
jgi:hypothetical protein